MVCWKEHMLLLISAHMCTKKEGTYPDRMMYRRALGLFNVAQNLYPHSEESLSSLPLSIAS